jgi:hypothetical protein
MRACSTTAVRLRAGRIAAGITATLAAQGVALNRAITTQARFAGAMGAIVERARVDPWFREQLGPRALNRCDRRRAAALEALAKIGARAMARPTIA